MGHAEFDHNRWKIGKKQNFSNGLWANGNIKWYWPLCYIWLCTFDSSFADEKHMIEYHNSMHQCEVFFCDISLEVSQGKLGSSEGWNDLEFH